MCDIFCRATQLCGHFRALMRIYWSLKQIPELSGFSSRDRRRVLRRFSGLYTQRTSDRLELVSVVRIFRPFFLEYFYSIHFLGSSPFVCSCRWLDKLFLFTFLDTAKSYEPLSSSGAFQSCMTTLPNCCASTCCPQFLGVWKLAIGSARRMDRVAALESLGHFECHE